MPNIILEDESLRDGLQFENKTLSICDKLNIFELLVEAGCKRIQVGSFVHPKWVPQMADTDELISRISKTNPDVTVTALVLNGKGLERAIKSGLGHISMSVSASNTHSIKNTRMPTSDALEQMVRLIRYAAEAGIKVRAGIQCAFGCVYEGEVAGETVIKSAEAMVSAGAIEVNLADTTGMAGPLQVKRMVHALKEAIPDCDLSLHLHNTRGLGLVNMMAGYESGVQIFDVAAGGLGGCPYVKGASGNIPTEEAAYLFGHLGEETGIDIARLCSVVESYERLLEKHLQSNMMRIYRENKGCI